MQTLTVGTGAWLMALREGKGLAPEEVPYAMLRANIPPRNVPSGRTIRRAETTGSLPHIRYRFGLAQFYEVPVSQLWPVERRAA